MRIRKGNLKDIPDCIRLCKIPEFPYLAKLSALQAKQYLKESVRKGIFLVAEEKQGIICLVFGEPLLHRFAWLDGLSVDKKFRGKGIGGALFRSFCKAAKGKGCAKVYLTAPARNKKTLQLYKSLGLEQGTSLVDFLFSI